MEKQVELLKKLCREHGMRLTPQRLEIFRVIDSAKDHPSNIIGGVIEIPFHVTKSRVPTRKSLQKRVKKG